ncbi:hypothetical protein ACK8P5_26270 (plasmid) [Paenibacillus sp. EC2-1]|uniref:hypothetical protein n=1 Tax=Paenibacillus sp. EC2-1 TaxID=3388665 RepID=UPI003BEF3AA7
MNSHIKQVRIYYKNGRRMSDINDLPAAEVKRLLQMIRKKGEQFIEINSPQKTLLVAKSDISHVEVDHE